MNESDHKRKDAPLPSSNKSQKKVKRVGPKEDSVASGDAEKDGDGNGKPKRTRTGCLTCRERHLKCDEGLPFCNNCKKSNRTCKRGVRLNFIDTWVQGPKRIVSCFGTDEWSVQFLDESREIASEYQGGAERYPLVGEDHVPPDLRPSAPERSTSYDFSTQVSSSSMVPQPLPPINGIISEILPDQQQHHDVVNVYDPQLTHDQSNHQPPHSRSGSTTRDGSHPGMATPGSVGSFSHARVDQMQIQDSERKNFLDSAEETLFMQVFVEEVGLWMDSMDPDKHFSRVLPLHSLAEPMLLNAFLACGARHLTLVNPVYTEEKALHYYDTATRYLLKNLQNPERDTIVCATTAVILNVYEIMSERPMQRMNHIAGARALIKECGWNARAPGIGSACFWLNVGLEVLSCLHFNWQVAWDPDDWGLDLDFSRDVHHGREEVWTHRMLYLIAKVCNFRATVPRYDEATVREQQIRAQQRYEEWSRLRGRIDSWNQDIPRSMLPMAYLLPHQTSTKSAFPEVWLVKRSTIVARLFYHTAMLLLAQTNPYYSSAQFEMAELQMLHAHMVCGISAHVKDRGVASVAIRSLAHAAEVLTDRREQEEVLRVFDKINKDTGWRIGFVYMELKAKWGWNEEMTAQEYAQTHTAAQQKETQQLQVQAQTQAAQSMHLQQQQQSGLEFSPHQQAQFAHQQQQSEYARNLSVSSIPPPPPIQPQPQLQQTNHHQHHQHSLSNSRTPSQSDHTPPTANNHMPSMTSSTTAPASASNAPKRPPQGIPNPLYAKADFSLPQHPYQNFYVAPALHMQHQNENQQAQPQHHSHELGEHQDHLHASHPSHGQGHATNGDVGNVWGYA